MDQVIQARDLFIPYLEVTNNLWKGHVFTVPKKVTRIAKVSICCVKKKNEYGKTSCNFTLL